MSALVPGILAAAMTFSPETSLYQRVKIVVLSALPLSRDALHVYLGCAALLATAALLRKPLSSFKVLLPGLALSLAMEAADLRDDRREGRLRWRASVHDLVNTNLLPLALVLLARARAIKS